MVVNTSIVINGSAIDSFNNCNVTKSLGNEYASNEFSADINNYAGRNGSKFSMGNSVVVYVEEDYDIMNESLRNNIVGYWKLDENITWISKLDIEYSNQTPVKDSTGNFVDGVPTDDVVVNLTGKINNSLEFIKTSPAQVSIPVNSNNIKQNPTDFSVSFWAKHNNSNTVTDEVSATFNSGTGYWNWAFSKNLGAGNSTMAFLVYDNNLSDLYEIGIGSTSNNNWNYFVGTYTGSPGFSKFYINGSLTGSLPVTKCSDMDNILFNDLIPSVGTSLLDEVILFNNVLTAQQVLDLYNNGSGLSYGKKIFNGLVEDVKFTGQGVKEEIKLTGRDWTLSLQDRTVQPEVYTNTTAGSIVRDIMLKYTDGISTSGVQDRPLIIDRLSFNHTPVFDAIKQLADYSQFIFYVDENKDLKFQERKVIEGQYVYDSEVYNNVPSSTSTKTSFKEQRDTIYNQVWVYGDRYLDGFKETFTANGGSVFTLLYNPHNTSVTSSGLVIQPGAIEGITYGVGSNIKYTVAYDDKQIKFISGTQQGSNIPASGVPVVVTYDRSLPIIKVGDNEVSKQLYGTRVKVIQDKSIKDPNTAELIMLQNLDDYSEPQKQGTLYNKGIDDVSIGENVWVNNPYQNIIWKEYEIVEINYDLNKSNCLENNVMSLKLNKKLPDITDKLKEIILEVKKMQAQDMFTSENLTRFQYTVGSLGIRQSGCLVYESSVTGSAYHLYTTGFTPPTNPFHLASGTNQGFLSGEPVGSAFTPFTISWSGSYLT